MSIPKKKMLHDAISPCIISSSIILIVFFLLMSKKIGYERKDFNYRENNRKKKYLYPGLKVGIIMPAFNEEMAIGNTLERIPKDVSDKMDVIVVDDGSKDNTVEIAEKYETIIIRHPYNKGNGAAIQTGLQYCKDHQYDITIIIDADGQHDPKYIKDFVEPIVEEDYDYVIGNRFRYEYDMNTIKKVCSRVMSTLLSFILDQKISDPTMGFRALSWNVVKDLYCESNYSITLEMLFKIVPYYRSCEIPIRINQRLYGKSFIKLKKYFYKTLFSFIKFYMFPKIHRYTYRMLKREFRRKVFYLIKT
ncbi:MAG: glycosyltransferase [Candidatus Lokiarchaeota archaeon]|nr:glycosyltransferase [Candidatus Lokiarchaeota archaeon]